MWPSPLRTLPPAPSARSHCKDAQSFRVYFSRPASSLPAAAPSRRASPRPPHPSNATSTSRRRSTLTTLPSARPSARPTAPCRHPPRTPPPPPHASSGARGRRRARRGRESALQRRGGGGRRPCATAAPARPRVGRRSAPLPYRLGGGGVGEVRWGGGGGGEGLPVTLRQMVAAGLMPAEASAAAWAGDAGMPTRTQPLCFTSSCKVLHKFTARTKAALAPARLSLQRAWQPLHQAPHLPPLAAAAHNIHTSFTQHTHIKHPRTLHAPPTASCSPSSEPDAASARTRSSRMMGVHPSLDMSSAA
jgi:hypothetical protein